METRHFIRMVQTRAHLSSETMAEDGTRIVLSLLCRRLTPEEVRDVESQLTQPLKAMWNSFVPLNGLSEESVTEQLTYRKASELYDLVNQGLAMKQVSAEPERLVDAVFHMLKEQVAFGESEDIAGQLPSEIEQIWNAA